MPGLTRRPTFQWGNDTTLSDEYLQALRAFREDESRPVIVESPEEEGRSEESQSMTGEGGREEEGEEEEEEGEEEEYSEDGWEDEASNRDWSEEERPDPGVGAWDEPTSYYRVEGSAIPLFPRMNAWDRAEEGGDHSEEQDSAVTFSIFPEGHEEGDQDDSSAPLSHSPSRPASPPITYLGRYNYSRDERREGEGGGGGRSTTHRPLTEVDLLRRMQEEIARINGHDHEENEEESEEEEEEEDRAAWSDGIYVLPRMRNRNGSSSSPPSSSSPSSNPHTTGDTSRPVSLTRRPRVRSFHFGHPLSPTDHHHGDGDDHGEDGEEDRMEQRQLLYHLLTLSTLLNMDGDGEGGVGGVREVEEGGEEDTTIDPWVLTSGANARRRRGRGYWRRASPDHPPSPDEDDGPVTPEDREEHEEDPSQPKDQGRRGNGKGMSSKEEREWNYLRRRGLLPPDDRIR
ncbi:MAG: hypothetical protein DHS80DRAFT_23797 [Piptocephalis tieghemiana]|nr:MAG: hypothetical protein DHS80DRAFT_23797 [Piptocephalis tieghemiana]